MPQNSMECPSCATLGITLENRTAERDGLAHILGVRCAELEQIAQENEELRRYVGDTTALQSMVDQLQQERDVLRAENESLRETVVTSQRRIRAAVNNISCWTSPAIGESDTVACSLVLSDEHQEGEQLAPLLDRMDLVIKRQSAHFGQWKETFLKQFYRVCRHRDEAENRCDADSAIIQSSEKKIVMLSEALEAQQAATAVLDRSLGDVKAENDVLRQEIQLWEARELRSTHTIRGLVQQRFDALVVAHKERMLYYDAVLCNEYLSSCCAFSVMAISALLLRHRVAGAVVRVQSSPFLGQHPESRPKALPSTERPVARTPTGDGTEAQEPTPGLTGTKTSMGSVRRRSDSSPTAIPRTIVHPNVLLNLVDMIVAVKKCHSL